MTVKVNEVTGYTKDDDEGEARQSKIKETKGDKGDDTGELRR